MKKGKIEKVVLVTGEEMASIDRRATQKYGVDSMELMESAGRAVFEQLKADLGSVAGDQVAVLCGKGNNGGDGFVVARLLAEAGAKPFLFLFAKKEKVLGDAATAMTCYLDLELDITEVTDSSGVKKAVEKWKECDMVIDALLGTGLSGPLRECITAAIEAINALGSPVLSVDIPSGVDASTGAVATTAVRATKTVTFALPKIGHLFYPGKSYAGTLHLADIGIPESAVSDEGVGLALMTSEEAECCLPKREPTAHKGDCGRVLVLAGSVGMTGAAAMSAMGAQRAGAGVVSAGCPKSLNDILEIKLTEAMTLPLPEVKRFRCLSLRAVGPINQALTRMDSAVIGPGLGRHRETLELVRRVVANQNLPTVIDADGLYALGTAKKEMFGSPEKTVLTPHAGEAVSLFGRSKAEIVGSPVETAREAAKRLGVTVLLKGAPTVTAQADGQVWVNSTGNAGMATAGTGDILAGIIGGLLAQGLDSGSAARLGVFLHGKAGDLAALTVGQQPLIATDLLQEIGPSIKSLFNA